MDPILVMLPGLDGTTHLFEPFLDEWSGEAITIQYPATLPSDYETLLPIVLDALPAERRYVLLGWSFSGPLALMAACERPSGLVGLVLCASFVQKPLRYIPRALRHVTWPMFFRMTGSVALAKTALAGHASPRINAAIKRAHGAVPAKVMAARVRQVLEVDVRHELAACAVPILYLKSAGDRVVPAHNADAIQRAQPSVEIKTIPGPHIALATHASDAVREIGAFVRRCDDRLN